MLDKKIKIYIKFWVWKSFKNLVGTKIPPPFMKPFLNFWPFWPFSPPNPANRPPWFFQKIPRTIVVLGWTNRFLEKRCSSAQNWSILTIFLNSPNWAKMALFAVFWVRIGRSGDELHFLSGDPLAWRRTTIVREVFWKDVCRAEIRGRFDGLSPQNAQKLGNDSIKRGA